MEFGADITRTRDGISPAKDYVDHLLASHSIGTEMGREPMADPIRQDIVLNASPKRVYDALLDSRQFSEFTGGAPAQISRDPGGAFSCFGGMITGRNVELIPNQRIVQAWRAGSWPEGIYSIVKFEIDAHGAGVRLSLHHAGFPEGNAEHLESGWHKMYWEPLRKYLEQVRPPVA